MLRGIHQFSGGQGATEAGLIQSDRFGWGVLGVEAAFGGSSEQLSFLQGCIIAGEKMDVLPTCLKNWKFVTIDSILQNNNKTWLTNVKMRKN